MSHRAKTSQTKLHCIFDSVVRDADCCQMLLDNTQIIRENTNIKSDKQGFGMGIDTRGFRYRNTF